VYRHRLFLFRRSRIVQKVSAILLGVNDLLVNVICNLEPAPLIGTADHPLLAGQQQLSCSLKPNGGSYTT
jgi:hypothetical protein